jgi:hypothetical protein
MDTDKPRITKKRNIVDNKDVITTGNTECHTKGLHEEEGKQSCIPVSHTHGIIPSIDVPMILLKIKAEIESRKLIPESTMIDIILNENENTQTLKMSKELHDLIMWVRNVALIDFDKGDDFFELKIPFGIHFLSPNHLRQFNVFILSLFQKKEKVIIDISDIEEDEKPKILDKIRRFMLIVGPNKTLEIRGLSYSEISGMPTREYSHKLIYGGYLLDSVYFAENDYSQFDDRTVLIKTFSPTR